MRERAHMIQRKFSANRMKDCLPTSNILDESAFSTFIHRFQFVSIGFALKMIKQPSNITINLFPLTLLFCVRMCVDNGAAKVPGCLTNQQKQMNGPS